MLEKGKWFPLLKVSTSLLEYLHLWLQEDQYVNNIYIQNMQIGIPNKILSELQTSVDSKLLHQPTLQYFPVNSKTFNRVATAWTKWPNCRVFDT